MIYTNIKDLNPSNYQGNLQKAVAYLCENYQVICSQEVGKYEIDPSFFYMVQEYMSKDTTPWESHQKYIDIQLILSGEEKMDISHKDTLTLIGEYDSVKDWCDYEGQVRISMEMHAGDIAIFFPEDAHQPGLKTLKGNMPIKKCLFKVLI